MVSIDTKLKAIILQHDNKYEFSAANTTEIIMNSQLYRLLSEDDQ